MKQSVLFLLMFCLFLPIGNGAQAGDISVAGPWIREAPAVAETLAAFMSISNSSTHTVQLKSASSDDFSAIEIHQTMMHEGMAHMLRQSSLQITGGGSVELKPGGYHLMLLQPKRPLPAGTEVTLRLSFDNGETIAVAAVVRKQ